RDAMSGFFLIRRDRLEGLETSASGFKIALELLVRAQPRSVGEVPYVFVGRTAGHSKMSTGEGLIFLRQLMALFAYQRRLGSEPIRRVELASSPAMPDRPAVLGKIRA